MKCHHYGDMSLSLRLRIAFFSESNPPLATSCFFPPRDLRGKSSGAEDLSDRRWMSLRWLYPHVPHSFPTESFLHPPGPSSLCSCKRSGLIRWEHWGRDGRQPVIGGFRCRGAVGLVKRPHPLAFCTAQRIQPPPTTIGWKAKAAHPSKPCRMTSALAGRAYSSARQAALALHSMAVLQVFQAKFPHSMDESNPNPAAFSELRSVTDLALRATKITAQAIGRSMAHLLVLERHLWLNLTEMKDADKVPFLESHRPVWSCSRGHCWALQSHTEVAQGNATLPA